MPDIQIIDTDSADSYYEVRRPETNLVGRLVNVYYRLGLIVYRPREVR